MFLRNAFKDVILYFSVPVYDLGMVWEFAAREDIITTVSENEKPELTETDRI